MVRGNWQKRVEIADARRKESKQRKQQTDDRRHYKAWVSELLQLLDRLGRRPLRLHIWTDTISSDSPPLLDILDDHVSDIKPKRRGRAVSFENESAMRKGGARGRSGSFSESGHAISLGKKKVHPRSKESNIAPESEERDAPLLCRSHFFADKCEDSLRKKGSCRYLHYSSRFKTLSSVLHTKRSSDTVKQDVKFAEEAAAADVAEDVARTDPGAMEMIYYLHLELKGDTEEMQSISDELSEALSARDIKLSSIVYVALDNALLFDRNREGLQLTDREFLFASAGEEGMGDRRISIGSEEDGSVADTVNELPGPILEHILTYLPDSAVATASQVCKAWHHEIGATPNLWLHLLRRRDWPFPQPEHAEDTTRERDPVVFREAFVQHYTAMRDLNAIKTGIDAITRKQVAKEKEMCYQDFSTRKHAPSASNSCVGLQVWSPKRILAAYSRDCCLRLFESESRGGSVEKVCRELVTVRVDPYKNTKRRSCVLVSMGLDDESIGCLCHVMASNIEAEAYILVVLSRDDFLLGDSVDSGSKSDELNLNVIDIGEAVLNYLLSSDVVDHRMLQLIDFLSDGGAIGDVEVLLSQTMAACGYGRFMVEISISIPNEEDGIGIPMRLVDRRLVLFSASAGAIVWMGESNELARPLRPRREEMTLASLRRPRPGGSRAACSIVVASISTPAILAGAIEPTGHVQGAQLVEASDVVRNELIEEGWDIRSWTPQRLILITESDIVAVDVKVRLDNGLVLERRTIVSFYPRYPAVNGPSHSILSIDGDLEALKIADLSDSHVILLCRHHQVFTQFGTTPIITEEKSVYAIVVHVPSRSEIGRLSLIEGIPLDMSEFPDIIRNDTTIGVGLSWKGIVMTGSAVRSVGDSNVIVVDTPRLSKKKKKRIANSGGKKDGFARGMTLRG